MPVIEGKIIRIRWIKVSGQYGEQDKVFWTVAHANGELAGFNAGGKKLLDKIREQGDGAEATIEYEEKVAGDKTYRNVQGLMIKQAGQPSNPPEQGDSSASGQSQASVSNPGDSLTKNEALRAEAIKAAAMLLSGSNLEREELIEEFDFWSLHIYKTIAGTRRPKIIEETPSVSNQAN